MVVGSKVPAQVMMIWRRPRANEVNFLPWLEQELLAQRRRLYRALAALLITALVVLAPVAWQYTLWQQATSKGSEALQSGRLYLHQQQHNSWLASHARRQVQSNDALLAHLQHRAWLPARELATLVGKLSTPSQLSRWRWTKTDGQPARIEFVVSQLAVWQPWWQAWLQARPSAKMTALEVEPQGVNLRVQYLIAQGQPEVVQKQVGDLLALRPPPLTPNLAVRPAADMVQRVSHLSTQVEVSAADDRLQLNAHLPPSQWGALAPLPGGVGWSVNELSLVSASEGHWRLAMNWQLDPAAKNLSGVIPAVSLAQQRSISLTLSKLTAEPKAVQTPEPESVKPIPRISFVGYSQPLKQAASVWLRHAADGKVVRLKLGQSLGQWRLVAAHAQQVTLVRGSQQLVLQPRCLTGVCP